jgi:phage repressor protein C with HTH and peptisase S24 domain
MSYQDRLRQAFEASGESRAGLAGAMGISVQAVGDVLNGKTKALSAKNNFAAAHALRVDAGWLATGEGKMRPEEPEPEHAGTMLRVRRVPVVGTAKMGDDGYYDEVSSIPGAGDGHIEIAVDDPNAYGIRVRGQSMFPAIRDGWYVLVKPNGTPQEGEYVLLKLADGRKMVKELLFRRAGSIEVMSVNGGERLTFELSELEGIQAIGAVVSPSQWRPD